MENFILSTDTCCDEMKSNLKRSRISYISMNYIYNDEVFPDEADCLEDYKFFYDEMKRGKIFSTTGINSLEITEYFEKLLEKGKDILHVCLSSGLSGTCNIVKQAAFELNKSHENKIYVLDSLSATQVENAILNYAKMLRDDGETAAESIKILENAILHLQTFFFLSDLDALRRGGRISGAAAMLGKAMQLRPLLTFDKQGKLRVIEKIMGTKKAIKVLLDKLVSMYDKESSQPIFIAFAGDGENKNELMRLISERMPNVPVISGPVGPVIASHTGPSLLAIIFFSKTERID